MEDVRKKFHGLDLKNGVDFGLWRGESAKV